MLICLCKGINERKLRQLAGRGLTLKDIQAHCQAGTDCGSCLCQVKNIVDESREKDTETA